MKTKYQNIDREFTSPVGIAGAVYAFLIYLLATISIIAFQNDDQVALISFVVTCASLSLYYYFFSRHTQTFSEDEKKIMFRVHVINYNTSGTKRRHVQQTNKNSIRRLLFGYFYSESQNSSRSNHNVNEKSSGGVSEASSQGEARKEEVSSIRKTVSSSFSKTGSARIASTSNNDVAAENVFLRRMNLRISKKKKRGLSLPRPSKSGSNSYSNTQRHNISSGWYIENLNTVWPLTYSDHSVHMSAFPIGIQTKLLRTGKLFFLHSPQIWSSFPYPS